MPSQPSAQACFEDDRAIAGVVLVEGDTLVRVAQNLCQGACALLNRCAPQVLAVHFKQVEGAEHGGGVMPVSADQLEHGEATLVADDSLPVDQAGAQREQGHCRDDLREMVGEVVAVTVYSRAVACPKVPISCAGSSRPS